MRNRRHMECGLAFLATLLLSVTSVAAQDLLWSDHFGGLYNEKGYGCRETGDGGLILLGSTYSTAGGFDIYLTRLDSTGTVLYTRTYGGDSTDYGYDLQETSDGGYVIVGGTRSSGNGECDVYLIKTDSTGALQWSRTLGGVGNDEGHSVRVTADNGFIIGGTTSSYGAGYDDFYLIKTDSTGTLTWYKTFGGAGGEIGWAVRQTADSGFIMTGSTGSFGEGYSSIYAVRTNKNGDTLWTTTYGGAKADLGFSVEIVSDGGLIFAGATASSGAGSYDAYLVKTDPDGFQEWAQTYGGREADIAYSVLETSEGNFVLAGKTESYASYTKVYLVKANPVGALVWSRYYGGTKSDEGQVLIQNSQLNFVVAGLTYSYTTSGSDLYVLEIEGDQTTDVNEPISPEIPEGFALFQNYPNPFNQTTMIEYSVPARSDVTLTIYNILGQAVREWYAPSLAAGTYRYEWEGQNESGQTVATGVYFYRLQIGEFNQSKKMVLIK